MECFQAQTYPYRELLVVASGGNVRSVLPQDERIRYIHLSGQPWIGAARNIGCAHASGQVVVHWDDDDYSAPGRIADQVARLNATGKAVTGYRSMRFTDGDRWWLYRGAVNYALGTSLCYRLDWWRDNKFPPEQVGEDNAFVSRARLAGQLAVVDAGELMHASIHKDNTCPRDVSKKAWTPIAA